MRYILLSFIFLYNFSFAQSPQWNSLITTAEVCNSIDIDRDNNVYIVGDYNNKSEETSTINKSTIPLNQQHGIYFAKLDTALKTSWIKTFESSWDVSNPLVRVDNDNNAIVSLYWLDDVKFSNISVRSETRSINCLLAKFDSNGNLLWYNSVKAKDRVFINDLKVDVNNNIWITGHFGGDFTIESQDGNNQNFYKQYGTSGYVAKFDKSGNLKSAISPESNYDLQFYSLSVDNLSNVYLTGFFVGDIILNNQTINAYRTDIVILKYNSKLEYQWHKQIGTKDNDVLEIGKSITLDKEEKNIYVTGSFGGEANFGGGVVTTPDKNIFLAKYSVNGDLLWVKSMGAWSGSASTVESGIKVIVDKNDFIYLAGERISEESIIKNPSSKIWPYFMAKFYSNGDNSWAVFTDMKSYGNYCDFACDEKNNIYIGGKAYYETMFGKIEIPTETEYSMVGFLAKVKGTNEENLPNIPTFSKYSIFPIDEEPSLSVSPNPFSSSFKIRLFSDIQEPFEIQMFDNLGNLIFSKNHVQFHVNNETSVNPGNLANGVYHLRLRSKNRSLTQEIIKIN